MTSRERIRAVLAHEIPDRVPNGLGGCETEGMHILTYDRFQNVIGATRHITRLDTFMTNAVFELETIQKMEGDIILLASPSMCGSDLRGSDVENQWKLQRLWDRDFLVSKQENFITDSNGNVTWNGSVCPKGSFFFDSPCAVDMNADFDIPDPEDFNPVHDIPEDFLRRLESAAKTLYEETGLSICLGETITDLQIAPGGFVGSMILMKTAPDIMGEFLRKSTDAALSQLRQLDQAVGRYVDILSIAHDFGDNRGVTIGAPLWREIYKPHYARLFKGWKSITKMKVNLHSCGSVADILDDLIDCGVDILNPVQTSAKGMSAMELKQRAGDRLVFWGGGYDTQLFHPSDSPETVYHRVRETISVLKQGGGYLFSGVHNLPPDVSDAHLRAMMDAWLDERDY